MEYPKHNKYKNTALDAGGIIMLNCDYHPDYYVLTKYSDADMNIKAALDEAQVSCLYDGENVWIYSFKDSEKL